MDAGRGALVVLPLALIGGWLLNFAVQASIACLAFWVTRSSAVYEIWAGLFMVLSGYVLPTSLLPGEVATIARALPFHAALGFPTELAVGRLTSVEAATGLAIQWGWAAAAWLGSSGRGAAGCGCMGRMGRSGARAVLRLIAAQARMSALAALQYRLGFWTEGLLGALWSAIGVIPLLVATSYQETVAGWGPWG